MASGNLGGTYRNQQEISIVLDGDRELRCPTPPGPCGYVRLLVGGKERGYWDSEHFDRVPSGLAIAAILGAARAGATAPVASLVSSAHVPVSLPALPSADSSDSFQAYAATTVPLGVNEESGLTTAHLRDSVEPKSSRAASSWEARAAAFVRANIFAVAGLFMLLVGFSFLFPILIQNGYFPPWMRVIGGFLLGLGIASFGSTQSKKRGDYGTTLQGGGIAIMYLAIYGAHRFYGLIGTDMAFGGFLFLAAVLFSRALRQDSKVLAVVGMLGAYLAPILVVNSGAPLAVPLGYAFLLSIAAAAASFQKEWRFLNVVSLAASAVLSLAMIEMSPVQAPKAFCVSLLCGYTLLYNVIPVLMEARSKGATTPNQKMADLVVSTIPQPIAVLCYAGLYQFAEGVLSSAMGMVALYMTVMWGAGRASGISFASTWGRLAVLFGTGAIALRLDGDQVPLLFAVEGTLLCWIGRRGAKSPFSIGLGTFLCGLAGLGYVLALNGTVEPKVLTPLVLAMGGGWFAMADQDATGSQRVVELAWGLGWSFVFLLSIEPVRMLSGDTRSGIAWAYSALLAVLLHHIAERVRWTVLRRYCAAVSGVATMATAILFLRPAATSSAPILIANLGAMLALAAAFRVAMMNRATSEGPGKDRFFALNLVVALLLATEITIRGFMTDVDSVPFFSMFTETQVATAVTLFWGVVGVACLAALAPRNPAFRKPGMVILGIAAAKLILVDMSHVNTVARVISFMGLGALYLVVGTLTTRNLSAPAGEQHRA